MLTWEGVLDDQARDFLAGQAWRDDGLMRWLSLTFHAPERGLGVAQHGCECSLSLTHESDLEAVRSALPDSCYLRIEEPEHGLVYDSRRDGPEAVGLMDWAAYIGKLKRDALPGT